MAGMYCKLQRAVFKRSQESTSWSKLAKEFSLNECAIRRAYANWNTTPPESQPLDPSDIHIPMRPPGRPRTLTDEEEKVILDAIKYFATNHTPLTKVGVQHLVQHYVELMPAKRQLEINFKENRPSINWVTLFTDRHDLAYKSVRVIEDKRVQAVTPAHVAEHIARLRYAMDRYHIRDARFVFNMDQSGASFEKMTGRSLRKGVGPRHVALVHSAIRTKGNLERVTVMPIVSAAGTTTTPVIVYPGKQAHFRRVNGVIQTLHSFLPSCYLYQREVPGVTSAIIYDWAQKFVRETTLLRANSQFLLLLIDGYACHVQFNTLQLFRENRIIAIAMPAHTSHALQPLDVSVFSSYKSYLQREIHAFSMRKKVLDAFDIAACITTAYTSSITSTNIIRGFERAGVWDPDVLGATIDPLKKLFIEGGDEDNKENIGLNELLNSFKKKGRSLLRDANVEVDGTIRINTVAGANLTCDAVLEALKKREENKRKKASPTGEEMEIKKAYKESAENMRRYAQLAPERAIQRQWLDDTRATRRLEQIGKVRERLIKEYGSSQGPFEA